MEIKVLGPGCWKCHETEKIVRDAISEAKIDASVQYVNDIAEMARLGILSTPAVIVDGAVKSVGKVPSKAEVKGWFGK